MPDLISPPSMANRAFDVIEEMIVTLDLPPGHVFSESNLIDRVGIGRTPVREAIQRLSAAHLIDVLPRRGMIVSEIRLPDLLALLETRRELDRLIASRAARRADVGQKERILDCATEMLHAADAMNPRAFLVADRRADDLLAEAARNPFAAAAATPLHAHCRRVWYRYRREADLRRSAALYGSVLVSAAEGDESGADRAAAELIDYLVEFTRSVLAID